MSARGWDSAAFDRWLTTDPANQPDYEDWPSDALDDGDDDANGPTDRIPPVVVRELGQRLERMRPRLILAEQRGRNTI
jgi:hypothetical protein